MLGTDKIMVSKSRTYVIPMYSNGDYTEFNFKKFRLPEAEKNDSQFATWYYYNRIDGFGCGGTAFPAEFMEDVEGVGFFHTDKHS